MTSKFSGKCEHCGVFVIWVARWVHVLDGDNPFSTTCANPNKGEEEE